jgi:hypothetical protein
MTLFHFLDSASIEEENKRPTRSVSKTLNDHQNDLNFMLLEKSEMNEVDWPKISQRILETNMKAIRSKSTTSSTTSSVSSPTIPSPSTMRVNEKRYADPTPRRNILLESMFRKNVIVPFMKGVNRILCNMQKVLIPNTDCSAIDESPILPFFQSR